ncbi:MAG: hypothetical protein ACR2N5_07250, partial [Solirubrobacterales bacterium]
CVSGESDVSNCTAVPDATADGTGSGLAGVLSVAVSADGKSVYAAAEVDDSVARFNHNTSTGALTYVGCITGDSNVSDASSACAPIPSANAGGENSGLDGLDPSAVSADGKSYYVATQGDHGVARFNRNTSTGALTYVDCITGETESATACTGIPSAATDGDGSGLGDPESLAISADGKSIYLAVTDQDAVAELERNTSTGAITYGACHTSDASVTACSPVSGATADGDNGSIENPKEVVVSADGRSVYSAANTSSAVARFDRETPDTSAPDITLKGKKKQKNSKFVKVKVTVDEAATILATGTIKVPKVKGASTAAKKKKSKLKKKSKDAVGGKKVVLKLKLRKNAKKLTKKAHKKGKKAKAKVKITATDPAGNESTAKRKIKLKPKKKKR